MFNLYYINYAKAFEIAMQMDNKILAETIKDHGWAMNGELELGVDDKEVTTSFFKKILPICLLISLYFFNVAYPLKKGGCYEPIEFLSK